MFSENEEFTEGHLIDLTDTELQKLKNEQEFLTYLDEEGILKELQITAIQYEKTASKFLKQGSFIPPFRFRLPLDIIKIQEISDNLGYLFTKEIDAGMVLAKTVVFCGVRLMLPNIPLQKSDLQLVPLVVNLPITCEISELLHYPSLGVECVEGVLMSKTTLIKYVRSSVYSCESLNCPRNKWQRYPENFRNICPNCLSLMEEDVLSSDTGEEFICQIIPLKSYQSPGRYQALNVRVKGCTSPHLVLIYPLRFRKILYELCAVTDFCIGGEYKITGKLTENFFEAMNITPRPYVPEMGLSFTTFPKSITNLYRRVSEALPNCPWSFVYALSSSLGAKLIPDSSYLHLKMGLMLSLCTQKNDEAPTPLVAIGPDSVNAQYLLHTAGKLAEKYVRHSIAHSYLGGAAKPGLQPDIVWLEAGQLILASKGVCNLGDWSKYKKEQANYICQTIESGQIVLNKELGKTNLIDFVPLKCAVWTYWCHITTSRHHQLQLKTLINVFGIPFLAEEKNEKEVNKICLKNIKKGRRGAVGNNNTTIPPGDLKEFIKIINTREPCITDDASQLIRNYFVRSRRERPFCLSIGAIKTITSLAEAHARLSLRNEVLHEDVLSVLYLYEESISALFGESMISYPKLIWNEQEPIYAFMSKQLHRFRAWLTEYTST